MWFELALLSALSQVLRKVSMKHLGRTLALEGEQLPAVAVMVRPRAW
jgi:hypothetical protein